MIATTTSSANADVKQQRPSPLLRVTAWYFKLGGILFAFVAVSGLISGIVLHLPSSTEGMPYAQAMLIVSAASVALLATGILLAIKNWWGTGTRPHSLPVRFYYLGPKECDTA